MHIVHNYELELFGTLNYCYFMDGITMKKECIPGFLFAERLWYLAAIRYLFLSTKKTFSFVKSFRKLTHLNLTMNADFAVIRRYLFPST